MEFPFYYDIVCPYAYLASTRIEALAARWGARVQWRPVLLGGLFQALGSASVPAQTWSENKVRLGERDLGRFAERLGVDLRRPPEHPRRTVEAMRLLVAAPEAVRPALSAALYRAYWVDGRDVADRRVLAELASAHGVDIGVIDDPAVKEQLRAETAAASERGVFGVPTVFVGERLFWGQDRLHLVEAALGGPATLAEARAGMPEPTWPDPPPALDFFHDFSSPFSYLGSTQVQRLASASGARLHYRPILLGGLFRTLGTPDVPLLAMSPPRQRWYTRDMFDQAAWLGVPFRFPSVFPIRTVLPLRVSLVEPRVIDLLYRALWVEDRDIGRPEVLAEVLREAGYDAAALLAAADEPAIKDALRQNTEAAAAAGACGVPSFQVDGQLLFWGVDRLDQVEAALSGWRPAAG